MNEIDRRVNDKINYSGSIPSYRHLHCNEIHNLTSMDYLLTRTMDLSKTKHQINSPYMISYLHLTNLFESVTRFLMF